MEDTPHAAAGHTARNPAGSGHACCGGSAAAAGGHGHPATVTDPVCGMSVAADAPISHEHAGTTYRFCCNGCRTKFAADPEGWLSGSARKPAAEAPADAVYTCPMHPEIEQIGPGDLSLEGQPFQIELE